MNRRETYIEYIYTEREKNITFALLTVWIYSYFEYPQSQHLAVRCEYHLSKCIMGNVVQKGAGLARNN